MESEGVGESLGAVGDVGGVDVGGGVVGGGDVGGVAVGGADVVPEPVGVGVEETGGGTDRAEDPCRVTRASAGVKEMTAVHAPPGSSDRSTVTTRVIDSPGRNTPLRADIWSQYAEVRAAHRTGAVPCAVSVIRVAPGAGAALTENRLAPSPGPAAADDGSDTVTVGDDAASGEVASEREAPPDRPGDGTVLPVFS